ncbi:MAG TPA: sugar phosphate nucleotidyltransferase [Candidatus Dormibacteraeota bacterium]|nr:sugar phosphate nucleotidyltransferase [Candidatus Dormibacteraeota bacterium]
MVLAGGSGTRLWPRSRSRAPKHLSPLAPDGRSLLRHAYDRAARLGGAVLVVTAVQQAAQVLAELPELEPDRLLLEPEPRGTGPALAWAALSALQLHPRAVLVSLHADHYMPDVAATTRALLSAAAWASHSEVLITIGLKPSWGAPGFGYVEVGPELARPGRLEWALPLFQSRGFVEKPDPERAQEMLASGGYFWNTGLFAWQAQLFLNEMDAHAPEVVGAVRAAVLSQPQGSEAFAGAWGKVPSGVVDRLVLERSSRVAILPVGLTWSDLGSFLDLYQAALDAGEGDSLENVVRGDALVLASDRSYVDSAGKRLVVVLGAEQLAVIDTEDALLVCPLSRVQEVTRVVDELRQRGRTELL